MKFELSEPFKADYTGLNDRERHLFRAAVRQMNAAYERRVSPVPLWPAALRIRRLRGHRSIWEMTWSFAGPAGRATVEIIDIDGEPGVRWRRIGGHRIFDEP